MEDIQIGYTVNSSQKQRPLKKIVNGFTIDLSQRLGSGSFSHVYKAIDPLQQECACKIVNQKVDQEILKDLMQEVNSLKKIMEDQKTNKQNLCEILGIFNTLNNVYIFSELCNQGTLENYIKTKKPNLTRKIIIFQELVQGYNELYKLKIVHRDIKLQNILMHNDHPKFIDFGFSRTFSKEQSEIMKSFQKYTIHYASPQIFSEEAYTYKTDIFSLGVTFYLMLNDLKPPNFPFTFIEVKNWHSRLKQFNIQNVIQFNERISFEYYNLVCKMLAYEESERIEMEELIKKSEGLIRKLNNNTITNPEQFQEVIDFQVQKGNRTCRQSQIKTTF